MRIHELLQENYVVKPGDTLSKIAASQRTTVSALAAANPKIKDINKIYPGDTIQIPGGSDQPLAPPEKKLPKKPDVSLTREANARKVYDYMSSVEKFSPIQSAAWVGCIWGESKFDPNAVGREYRSKTGETFYSYGICQWNKTRFANLQKFAKARAGHEDRWKDNLQLQLEFLSRELDTTHKNVALSLAQPDLTLEASLQILISKFEISGNQSGDLIKRLPFAQAALTKFNAQPEEKLAFDRPRDSDDLEKTA